MTKISVLFVCRANICRSPMAEGIFKEKIRALKLNGHIKVDSAGTQASLLRLPPDARARKVLLKHGVNISKLKSRKFKDSDWKNDYVLVMDRSQLKDLEKSYPRADNKKVQLVRAFNDECFDKEVPDPYFGNLAGFEYVYHLLDVALDAFLLEISEDIHSERSRASRY